MIKRGPKTALALLALALISGCDQPAQVTAKDASRILSNKCSVDLINGSKDMIVAPQTSNVDFRGWAVDSNSNTAPPVLNLVLTNKNGQTFVYEKATRTPRPDVAKGFKQEAFLQAGFHIVTDVSGLAKDTYLISLQMPATDGRLITCSTPKVLQVK